MTHQPILVTGMPRSGTTWLARELAGAQNTALAGREPMNPRGRQYALGGSLEGWVRMTSPTARQKFLLKRSFDGLNPMVYSRYGHNQWKAPLPWVRMIVKDPFAMLSIPAIVRVTSALPVLVYRHPAAVLSSFRRMGWAPDPREVAVLERIAPRPRQMTCAETDLHLVGRMWTALHSIVLSDLDALSDAVVVSHERLAGGGDRAFSQLLGHLGLDVPAHQTVNAPRESSTTHPQPDPTKLHNLTRDPQTVAGAWRTTVDPSDTAALELMANDLLGALEERELYVG